MPSTQVSVPEPSLESVDGVRPFRAQDLKSARLLIGSSAMEQLTAANLQSYWNPKVLAIWLVLSLGFMHLMDWYPKAEFKLTYISPLFAFFSTAVPIMFGFEWLHRSHYEKQLRLTMGAPDLINPAEYYSASAFSSFLVYVHKGNVIALIACDAGSRASEEFGQKDAVILGETGWDSKKKEKEQAQEYAKEVLKRKEEEEEKAAAEAATGNKKTNALRSRAKKSSPLAPQSSTPPSNLAKIRHFHVDLLYRRTTVGSALLSAALSRVFAPGSPITEVVAPIIKTQPNAIRIFKKFSFKVKDGTRGEYVGLRALGLGWVGQWVGLQKSGWDNLN